MSSTRLFNRPLRAIAAMTAACAMSFPALALPTLQLDIGDGSRTAPGCSFQTTCAGSQSFTLYALYTPVGNPPPPTDTYYISAALESSVLAENTPITMAGNYGSFTFNGNLINVTNDMDYGRPTGLPDHGAFDTYFTEFAFTFSPGTSAARYDAQTAASPHAGPSGSGDMLYRAFAVDTTNLSSQVKIHFDLYHKVSENGPVDENAPFSHDAESEDVPAPAVLTLLGMGLMLAGAMRSRARA